MSDVWTDLAVLPKSSRSWALAGSVLIEKPDDRRCDSTTHSQTGRNNSRAEPIAGVPWTRTHHFNRQGDSYRLRSFVGALAGRAPWMQPDAPTSSDFLRLYRPEHKVDVAGERISLERVDRWETIVTHHNRRLGIPH